MSGQLMGWIASKKAVRNWVDLGPLGFHLLLPQESRKLLAVLGEITSPSLVWQLQTDSGREMVGEAVCIDGNQT